MVGDRISFSAVAETLSQAEQVGAEAAGFCREDHGALAAVRIYLAWARAVRSLRVSVAIVRP